MAPPTHCPNCRRPWAPTAAAPVCPACRPARSGIDWPVVAAASTLALLIAVGAIALAWAVGHAYQVDNHAPVPVAAAPVVRTGGGDELPPPVELPPPPAAPAAPAAPPAEPVKPAEPGPVIDPALLERFAVALKALVGPPAEAAAAQPEPIGSVVVKHRQPTRRDELERQLLKVPQVALTSNPRAVNQTAAFGQALRTQHPLREVLPQRPDINGLPMRMGMECHLSKESAETLQVLSRKLRTLMGEAATQRGAAAPAALADPRPDADFLRAKLLNGGEADWQRPEAVATLEQLFQAEGTPVRRLLVEMLDRIPGREAGDALTRRAVFDLAADVREAAVVSLGKRPAEEYRAKLVADLRYPWPVAADHAAEALVALKAKDAVPDLVRLLDQPDPARPTVSKNGQASVRELVRVNHLGNCLLCHAPSQAQTDLVRGRMPSPGQPVPAVFSTQYYESGSPGQFVRADVTYLQQDFAVAQPIESPGAWPEYQRYDYVVRTRLATGADLRRWEGVPAGAPYAQREAVLFALRELTGKDAGAGSDGWRRLTGVKPAQPAEPEPAEEPAQPAEPGQAGAGG
jgi:hypothetical protein